MTTNELGQPIGWRVQVNPPEFPSTHSMPGTFCELVALDSSAHAADLFDAYSAATDHRDWTYLPYGPFATAADLATFLSSVEGRNDPIFFTILDQDKKAIGVASYLRVNQALATIEVGHIHFSRELQQTPAATEAMYLMMQRAFATGYRRYEWKCDALNAPSRASAARLGFVAEGVWRQAAHYKGRNRDTAWFGIVDQDWPALEAEFERWLASDNFDDSGRQLSALQNHNGAHRQGES